MGAGHRISVFGSWLRSWRQRTGDPVIREYFLILCFTSLLFVNFRVTASADNGSTCSSSFSSSCRCFVVDSKAIADCSAVSLISWPVFREQGNSSFHVKILNVSYNDLSAFHFENLAELRGLKILDASHSNRLNVDDETEWPLPLLETLLLRWCGLVSVPSLSGLRKLVHLDLRGNRIGFISYRNFRSVQRSLQILDISENAIVSLPSDLFSYNSSLRILYLSQNQIATLPKHCFRNLTRLEALNLSYNSIRRLPKDILAPLVHLKDLDLSHNRLRRLEGLSFKGAKELRSLSLQGNRLNFLADGTFWDAPSLARLSLAGNRLMSVDRRWVYGLETLIDLNLSSNAIVRLDAEAWHFCRRVQILDLSSNRLATLRPRAFHHLRQLRYLALRENDLSLIYANAFESLNELITLDLSSNLLADVLISGQQIFLPLGNVKTLKLASNEIRVLPSGVFDGLVSMSALDLNDNPLVVFSGNAAPLPGLLKLVIMNTSSLLCDCQLTWLLDRGNSGKGIANETNSVEYRGRRAIVGRAECRHPHEWVGKTLFHLPTNISCGTLPRPMITSNPEPTTGFRGQNVTFECAARCQERYSDCHMTIHWRKNGRLLYQEPDSGLTVATQSDEPGNDRWWSRLTIEAAEDSDSGVYQCQFANELASVLSEKAQLVIFVPPTLVKKPVDAAVRVGGTVRLECAAQGHPAPTLSWRKDNDGDEFPAGKERRMHVMPTDDAFFIVDVKLQDAGVYTCIAKSAAGEDRAQARVSVYDFGADGPSFTIPEITVRPGATAVLECTNSISAEQRDEEEDDVGSNESAILWFRNGQPMTASSRSYGVSAGRVWIIKEASVTDQGLYACRATGTVFAERSWRLTVLAASDKVAKLGSPNLASPGLPPSAFPSNHGKVAASESPGRDAHTPSPPRGNTAEKFFDLNGIPGVLVVVVIACVVLTSLGWVLVIIWRRRRLSNPRGVATVVVSLHDKNALTALVPEDEQRAALPLSEKGPTAEPSVQVATIAF